MEINRQIGPQSFKVVFCTCEVTNNEMVVWLNTKNDDISKMQSTYSPLEFTYFHAIVEDLLESVDHLLPLTVCMNIASSLAAPFSRDNAERFLFKLIKGGYFINNNDNIYLGPRLIQEFMTYLKTFCSDNVCNLCSELVFYVSMVIAL